MKYALALVIGLLTGSATFAADDGLDEVNAARAARGLKPFIRNDALTAGAKACADFRAASRIQVHTSNDFAFAPAGANVSATGCAAWPVSLGWGACCTFDNYTHAGAGIAYGPDGLRYMSLFVYSAAPARSQNDGMRVTTFVRFGRFRR